MKYEDENAGTRITLMTPSLSYFLFTKKEIERETNRMGLRKKIIKKMLIEKLKILFISYFLS